MSSLFDACLPCLPTGTRGGEIFGDHLENVRRKFSDLIM
jgi:hypothetical protein